MGYHLYLYLLPVGLFMAGFSAVVVFRYRREATARPLFFFLLFSIFLIAVDAAELLVRVPAWKTLMAKMEHLFFPLIAFSFLSFSLRYVGNRVSFTNRLLVPFGVCVGALWAIVFTNEEHHLFWSRIDYIQGETLLVMRYFHGPLFWIEAVLVYGMILTGIALILWSFLKGPALFRRQSLTILAGVVTIGSLNLLYLTDLFPPGFKDYTPLGFALTGFLFAVNIYINRFFQVLPVSRALIPDMLGVGILFLDEKGVIVDINRPARLMLAADDSLIGKGYRESPEVAELLAVPLSAVTGSREWIEVSSAAGRIYDRNIKRISLPEGGGGWGYLLVFNDVTEQRRRERTLARLQEQLIESDKLAVLGQMAGEIAHEINNPLSYIRSSLRVLERTLPEGFAESERESYRNGFKTVQDGLERIEGAVRNLLAIIRDGRSQTASVSYDLNEGLERALDICLGKGNPCIAPRKELTPLPSLICRSGEIDQVLMNLIRNAQQALEEQGFCDGVDSPEAPLLTVRTYRQGDFAVCEIENRGSIRGIARDELFSPFVTGRREKGGTGMGLSIAAAIIRDHHGGDLSLIAASPVCFRFRLPVS